jgi:hypothetical protein
MTGTYGRKHSDFVVHLVSDGKLILCSTKGSRGWDTARVHIHVTKDMSRMKTAERYISSQTKVEIQLQYLECPDVHHTVNRIRIFDLCNDTLI